MTTPSTPARVEGTLDSVLACIPSNWIDSMLTGPQRVIGDPPYDCRDIERVLLAVRYRIEAHLKANTERQRPGDSRYAERSCSAIKSKGETP